MVVIWESSSLWGTEGEGSAAGLRADSTVKNSARLKKTKRRRSFFRLVIVYSSRTVEMEGDEELS